MARKGENIYKRKDGRWEARFIASRGGQGHARYRSVYARRYAEAKSKRQEAMRKMAEMDYAGQAKAGTVEHVAGAWLTDCSHRWKESTRCRYQEKLDIYIEGFYMQWVDGRTGRSLSKYFVYDETDEIGDMTEKLEGILSSEQPSVSDISDDGEILFASEKRSRKQIETMLCVQDTIIDEIKSYIDAYGRNLPSKELAQVLFSMTENVRLTKEAALENLYSYNDLGGAR